ncbi:hypothetical protein DFJ74DRAFT_728081 [Hyaloraphidium curvatum]|nr:hypothetical protein DFJ74DRAFT_728081 [Hyaloraphidium curvatum]
MPSRGMLQQLRPYIELDSRHGHRIDCSRVTCLHVYGPPCASLIVARLCCPNDLDTGIALAFRDRNGDGALVRRLVRPRPRPAGAQPGPRAHRPVHAGGLAVGGLRRRGLRGPRVRAAGRHRGPARGVLRARLPGRRGGAVRGCGAVSPLVGPVQVPRRIPLADGHGREVQERLEGQEPGGVRGRAADPGRLPPGRARGAGGGAARGHVPRAGAGAPPQDVPPHQAGTHGVGGPGASQGVGPRGARHGGRARLGRPRVGPVRAVEGRILAPLLRCRPNTEHADHGRARAPPGGSRHRAARQDRRRHASHARILPFRAVPPRTPTRLLPAPLPRRPRQPGLVGVCQLSPAPAQHLRCPSRPVAPAHPRAPPRRPLRPRRFPVRRHRIVPPRPGARCLARAARRGAPDEPHACHDEGRAAYREEGRDDGLRAGLEGRGARAGRHLGHVRQVRQGPRRGTEVQEVREVQGGLVLRARVPARGVEGVAQGGLRRGRGRRRGGGVGGMTGIVVIVS